MTIWVILLLSIIIYLLPIRDGESKEWGSDPIYLKPSKRVKKKQKINTRARWRRKLKIISSLLFSDREYK